MTQLTSVLNYIGGQLDAGKQIDLIYLDMKKALEPSYLEGCTNTALLANFTTGSAYTYTDATGYSPRSHFRELPVTSRVPQGSLLGPILSLLFVDDLPNTVLTSRVTCYVDDTKIFKSIESITDCRALQSDLNDLVSWSESS